VGRIYNFLIFEVQKIYFEEENNLGVRLFFRGQSMLMFPLKGEYILQISKNTMSGVVENGEY
jgi:hypothetical protein